MEVVMEKWPALAVSDSSLPSGLSLSAAEAQYPIKYQWVPKLVTLIKAVKRHTFHIYTFHIHTHTQSVKQSAGTITRKVYNFDIVTGFQFQPDRSAEENISYLPASCRR